MRVCVAAIAVVASVASVTSVPAHTNGATDQPYPGLLNLTFTNARTPVLPPVNGSRYDSTVCMNPFILQEQGQWRLYYAGADDSHTHVHRIALASPSMHYIIFK